METSTTEQDNFEEGEVPDSDEECTIVNISEAREPRRQLKKSVKKRQLSAFEKDLRKFEKMKNRRKETDHSSTSSSSNR